MKKPEKWMKISHLFFIFLILNCSGGFSPGQGKQLPPDGKKYSSVPCQKDTDCVLVKANCCHCSNGGKSIAVHKSQQEAYNRDIENYCSSIRGNNICLTVYNCDISYRPRCENSICITVVKRPEPPH